MGGARGREGHELAAGTTSSEQGASQEQLDMGHPGSRRQLGMEAFQVWRLDTGLFTALHKEGGDPQRIREDACLILV